MAEKKEQKTSEEETEEQEETKEEEQSEETEEQQEEIEPPQLQEIAKPKVPETEDISVLLAEEEEFETGDGRYVTPEPKEPGTAYGTKQGKEEEPYTDSYDPSDEYRQKNKYERTETTKSSQEERDELLDRLDPARQATKRYQ